MRLRFVSAPGGSAFMHELLSVVAHEAEIATRGTPITGVDVTEGPLSGAGDDIFVVVPHEFFRVLPEPLHPSDDVRRRTIGLCVEHPGTDTFEWTLRTARGLGACVDINDDSTLALHKAGIAVERFTLGYSDRWDRWGGAPNDRSIDVVYLGTTDTRRSRFLTQDAEVLDDRSVVMAMPPHEPMVAPRPDFFMGDDKLRLLGDTRLLVNLHRDASRSFEWVRALEAMCNGCVVVTEHSIDLHPLAAGRHVICGAPHRLLHVARSLLEHPDRLDEVRDEGYRYIRDELPMRPSAELLVGIALQLADGSWAPTRQPRAVPARAWPSWPSGAVQGTLPAASGQQVVLDGRTVDVAELEAAVAAATDDVVWLSAPGDRPFPRTTARLRALLAHDPALDAAYGFVITPDQQFASALPFEPERVLRTDHLALAAMWRRRSLLELLESGALDLRDPDPAPQLWRAAARQRRRVALLPRPAVRQLAVAAVTNGAAERRP